MVRRKQTDYCAACMLPQSDRLWLEQAQASGRLDRGVLRRLGIAKYVAYRHRHHAPGHLPCPYFAPAEWQRRRQSARHPAMVARRWQPGESGGGNRRDSKNKHPLRRGLNIAATVIAERAERRAQWEAERRAQWEAERRALLAVTGDE